MQTPPLSLAPVGLLAVLTLLFELQRVRYMYSASAVWRVPSGHAFARPTPRDVLVFVLIASLGVLLHPPASAGEWALRILAHVLVPSYAAGTLRALERHELLVLGVPAVMTGLSIALGALGLP